MAAERRHRPRIRLGSVRELLGVATAILGAKLSDKTARQEFGLTQDEIYDATDAGTLQYRQAYMHGNPWLRLLRREVEALARARHGDYYVSEQQTRAELTRVNREIRRLRTELAELEERRAKLGSDLGEYRPGVVCRNKRIFAVMT